MDAFAVSICKGLSLQKTRTKNILYAGIWFGVFQGIMPVIGYFSGKKFSGYVQAFDHWIVFLLLAIIGANMIKESLSQKIQEDCSCDENNFFNFKEMFLLSVATSIDALAVGISFALMDVQVFLAATIIAVVTFVISSVGVKIGNVFGTKYKSRAELAGGIILIMIGVKILIEHMAG